MFAPTYGLCAGTPCPADQIVAHSEGTFITQIYLRNLGGAVMVDRLVDISGFAEGTLGELTPLVEVLRAGGLCDRTFCPIRPGH